VTARSGLGKRLDAPDPGSLVAASSHLRGPRAAFDPLAAADHGHVVGGRALVVAGRGVAAELHLRRGLEDPHALAEVVEWLGSVERSRSGTSGEEPAPVVALGAFPFDRSAPAVLVVPRTTWCRSADGRAWSIRVTGHGEGDDQDGHGGRDDPAETVGRSDGEDPRHHGAGVRLSLRQVPPGHEYEAAVAAAVGDITAGHLDKVVLARMVETVGARELPAPSAILRALWRGDPAFSPFSVPLGWQGRLVGASPELLVGRSGPHVASHAFAGTVGLPASGGEDAPGRLLASAKDRTEHRLVVEAIARALEPRCAGLRVPAEPTVVRLRSDARLGTFVEGRLRGADTALDLLALLHPTPAVGGVPRPAALRRIASLEPAPRGYWAGTVGWVDARGDGEWVLAIRSVVVKGRVARIHAGAGVVAGSLPGAELAETTIKLAPVLEALCPGGWTLL
jgi:isochorismate synthase